MRADPPEQQGALGLCALKPHELRELELELRTFRATALSGGLERRDYASPALLRSARVALWITGIVLFQVSPLIVTKVAAVLIFACASVSMLGADFHDVIHLSRRNRTYADRLILRLASAPFAVSPLWWSYKHIRLHHMYPSHPDFDPDIQFGVLGRVSSQQRWRSPHRFQHIYSWPLLPFSLLNMLKPGEPAQLRRFERITGIRPGFTTRALMLDKYLPFAIWWGVLVACVGVRETALFTAANFLLVGLFVSLITQVQHNTALTRAAAEDVTLPPLLRQVLVSSDVGRAGSIWWYFCGGVNLHAVHHLAPSVPYSELPALSADLRRLLAENGIALPHHNGMISAIRSHYELISCLSKPVPATQHPARLNKQTEGLF